MTEKPEKTSFDNLAEEVLSPKDMPLRGIVNVQEIAQGRIGEAEQNNLRMALAGISRVPTTGKLTRELAHEINQPLAAILANAQAARHIVDSPSPDLQELRDALEDIINDDKRAREIIRRVRSMFKKDSPVQEPADINALIRESIKFLEHEYVGKSISVRMSLDERIPGVRVDRIQIRQVIINLLLNGIEAIGDGTGGQRIITVCSAINTGSEVTVSIQDTGKGIDEDSFNLLSEPFYTTKEQRLGLGLFISRSIIEDHGGKMSASPNTDIGATFSFSLMGESIQ